ncbi:hypothetical protein ABG067_004098 [Albugo candida]
MLPHRQFIVFPFFHAIFWLPLQVDTKQAVRTINQYDEELASYLVGISSAMYCPASKLLGWKCVACSHAGPLQNTEVVSDSQNTFQGTVGYSSDRDAIVISFRGSSNIKNWIANIKFRKKRAYNEYPEALVHRGFYELYQKVAAQVLASIRKIRHEHATAVILLTGHSLGGAIASICAFELKLLHGLDAHAVYTFGQPRLGNLAFAKLVQYYVPNLFRVIHADDLVPRLPPSYLHYHHSATEVRKFHKLQIGVLLTSRLQILYGKFSEWYRICSADHGEDRTMEAT